MSIKKWSDLLFIFFLLACAPEVPKKAEKPPRKPVKAEGEAKSLELDKVTNRHHMEGSWKLTGIMAGSPNSFPKLMLEEFNQKSEFTLTIESSLKGVLHLDRPDCHAELKFTFTYCCPTNHLFFNLDLQSARSSPESCVDTNALWAEFEKVYHFVHDYAAHSAGQAFLQNTDGSFQLQLRKNP